MIKIGTIVFPSWTWGESTMSPRRPNRALPPQPEACLESLRKIAQKGGCWVRLVRVRPWRCGVIGRRGPSDL